MTERRDGAVAEILQDVPERLTRPGRVQDRFQNRLPTEQAGVEVLGPVSHDGFVHSIYFFDPNGIRLELTLTVASETELMRFRDEAHSACADWTQEKRRRLAPSA